MQDKVICLAGGKHRWRYRQDSMLGKLRECQKCGVVQQRREHDPPHAHSARWVQIGQTAHRTEAQK